MKRLPNENHHDVASQGYLDMLHNILPPQAIIHIGAGGGDGEMHYWKQWDLPHALIIDADAARMEWANALLAGHPGWHVADAVVSDANGETNFYQATNPSEDGLIPAENLAAIWPNLRTVAQTPRSTIRLDTLLAEQRYSELEQSRSTWTIVDCLPVLPILQGAGDSIGHWSVLWLRVLLKPVAAIEEYASLQAIESFLGPLGYRCIHVAESNHPAIGTAIFVRDWQTVLNPQIEQLTQVQANQTQQLADYQTQIEVMTNDSAVLHEEKLILTQQRDALQSEVTDIKQERDEQIKLAGDRYTQIQALTQEKAALANEKLELIEVRDEQAKLAVALQGQITQLTLARDEQGKLAGDRYLQIESLTSEMKAQAQQLADCQTQIEVMTKDSEGLHEGKLALTQQRDALQGEVADIKQERDEQIKLAGDRYIQIESLKQEMKALAIEKAELVAARDAQIKLGAERQIQISQLTHTSNEAKSQLATLQVQLAQTNQVKAAQANLAAEQTQLANSRKVDLDMATQTIQEKDARITQLEAALMELENRQRLLDEEMIKAEAQIGLIKDVLLRESGL